MKTAHIIVHFQNRYHFAQYAQQEDRLSGQLQKFCNDIAPQIETFFIFTREEGMHTDDDVVADSLIPLGQEKRDNILIEEKDGQTCTMQEQDIFSMLRDKGIRRVILSGYYWDRCVAGWAGRLRVDGFNVAVIKDLTDYNVVRLADHYYQELEFPVIAPEDVMPRPGISVPALSL